MPRRPSGVPRIATVPDASTAIHDPRTVRVRIKKRKYYNVRVRFVRDHVCIAKNIEVGGDGGGLRTVISTSNVPVERRRHVIDKTNRYSAISDSL